MHCGVTVHKPLQKDSSWLAERVHEQYGKLQSRAPHKGALKSIDPVKGQCFYETEKGKLFIRKSFLALLPQHSLLLWVLDKDFLIRQMVCLLASVCVCACMHSFACAIVYMCSSISVLVSARGQRAWETYSDREWTACASSTSSGEVITLLIGLYQTPVSSLMCVSVCFNFMLWIFDDYWLGQ